MGSYTVYKLTLNLSTLFLVLSILARPAGAAPEIAGVDAVYSNQPARITTTLAQTITIPYSFVPIDFSGYSGPALPSIDLASVDFVNQMGSIALTLYGILDDFAILGYFALVAIGVMILFWIWGFVTNRPSTTALNVSGAIDVGAQLYGDYQQGQIEGQIDHSAQFDQADVSQRDQIRDSITGYRRQLTANSGRSADFRKAARSILGARRIRW